MEEPASMDAIFSIETQANCYQDFFDTVWNEDWFADVHIWQLRSDFDKEDKYYDLDFTPQGNPALAIIAKDFKLIVLENGGILIDNPGMREVGITDTQDGLELTFDTIVQLTQQCKFKDCKHIQEKGCAVLAALERGEIDEQAYFNYRKMEKEKSHFEADVQERRRKDKKFGKMIKNTLKHKRKYKF